jgi:hypothetical protein
MARHQLVGILKGPDKSCPRKLMRDVRRDLCGFCEGAMKSGRISARHVPCDPYGFRPILSGGARANLHVDYREAFGCGKWNALSAAWRSSQAKRDFQMLHALRLR